MLKALGIKKDKPKRSVEVTTYMPTSGIHHEDIPPSEGSLTPTPLHSAPGSPSYSDAQTRESVTSFVTAPDQSEHSISERSEPHYHEQAGLGSRDHGRGSEGMSPETSQPSYLSDAAAFGPYTGRERTLSQESTYTETPLSDSPILGPFTSPGHDRVRSADSFVVLNPENGSPVQPLSSSPSPAETRANASTELSQEHIKPDLVGNFGERVERPLLEESSEELFRENQRLKQDRDLLAQRLDEVVKEREQISAQSMHERDDVLIETQNLKQTNETLKLRLTEMERQNEEFKLRMSQVENEYENELKLSRENYSREIGQKDSEIQQIESMMNERSLEQEDIQKQIGEKDQTVNALEVKLGDLQKRCQQYETQIAQLELSVNEGREEVNRLKTESSKLLSERTDLAGECASLRQQLQELRNRHEGQVQHLQAEVERLADIDRQSETELSELRKGIDQLKVVSSEADASKGRVPPHMQESTFRNLLRLLEEALDDEQALLDRMNQLLILQDNMAKSLEQDGKLMAEVEELKKVADDLMTRKKGDEEVRRRLLKLAHEAEADQLQMLDYIERLVRDNEELVRYSQTDTAGTSVEALRTDLETIENALERSEKEKYYLKMKVEEYSDILDNFEFKMRNLLREREDLIKENSRLKHSGEGEEFDAYY